MTTHRDREHNGSCPRVDDRRESEEWSRTHRLSAPSSKLSVLFCGSVVLSIALIIRTTFLWFKRSLVSVICVDNHSKRFTSRFLSSTMAQGILHAFQTTPPPVNVWMYSTINRGAKRRHITTAHHALARRRPSQACKARSCPLRCNRNTHFGVVRVPIDVSNPAPVWMIARVPVEQGTFCARRALCPRLHRSDRLIRKHVRPSQRIRVRARVQLLNAMYSHCTSLSLADRPTSLGALAPRNRDR